MLIKQRLINQDILTLLKSQNTDDFISHIVSNRVSNIQDLNLILSGTIKDLSSPFALKNINIAVDRLYDAIQNGEVIGLETDHDCDGQTSHAILYEALTKVFNHPKDKIRSYIGHRMKEGYGLSESLVNRILMDLVRPSLIITADNGSTDEPRIQKLKSNSIDTIVTDHHGLPPEGAPKSAVAVINPSQDDCDYPDKSIAGCMVAWLLMAALRRKFILNNIAISTNYGLKELFDFVAIGTVADCVSMADSHNNRIVTKIGMSLLKDNDRTCWDFFDRDAISSEYIGFSIAPILNSDGRVSDALSSVSFLLEDNESKADETFNSLKKQNEQRKTIQKALSTEAVSKARILDDTNKSICILLEEGHAGIHGISASRINDMFGKPIIIFSQNQTDKTLISGSARSVEDIHIKNILDTISSINPTIMLKYGGHSGAAGLTIKRDDFDEFYKLFEHEVIKTISANNIILEPCIEYDFELEESHFNLETFDKISTLEPFGRGFEKPVFYNTFTVENFRLVGKDKTHAQMVLRYKNTSTKAIWFNASDIDVSSKIIIGCNIKVCYMLQREEYLGRVNLSLNVKAVEIEKL